MIEMYQNKIETSKALTKKGKNEVILEFEIIRFIPSDGYFM